MAAVVPTVTTVRAWDGGSHRKRLCPFGCPVAGFSIIEADDIDEAIRLVAKIPCARARGAEWATVLKRITACVAKSAYLGEVQPFSNTANFAANPEASITTSIPSY